MVDVREVGAVTFRNRWLCRRSRRPTYTHRRTSLEHLCGTNVSTKESFPSTDPPVLGRGKSRGPGDAHDGVGGRDGAG